MAPEKAPASKRSRKDIETSVDFLDTMTQKKAPTSKKSRKETETSGVEAELELDIDRFLKIEAQALYHKYIMRSFNIERVFDHKSFELTEMFKSRGWINLCAKPATTYAPIVREFYANKSSTNAETESWVRGKYVDYCGKNINEVYEIKVVGREKCEYQVNLKKGVDIEDEVTRRIAVTGAEWKRKHGKPWTLKESALKYEAMVMHRFVCSRLMPTSHLGEVYWSRAILIYTILSEAPIDAGEIMQDTVHALVNALVLGKSKAGFVLPSLVTILCKRAGVVWDTNDEKVPFKPSVNKWDLESKARNFTKVQNQGGEDQNVDSGLREAVMTLNDEVAKNRVYQVEQFTALRTYLHDQFANLHTYKHEKREFQQAEARRAAQRYEEEWEFRRARAVEQQAEARRAAQRYEEEREFRRAQAVEQQAEARRAAERYEEEREFRRARAVEQQVEARRAAKHYEEEQEFRRARAEEQRLFERKFEEFMRQHATCSGQFCNPHDSCPSS